MEAKVRSLVPRKGISHLARIINGTAGEIDIIALGPLTNIAVLLSDESLPRSKIRSILIVGGRRLNGSVLIRGNNLRADMSATSKVLASGIPTYLFTAESVASMRVLIPPGRRVHNQDNGLSDLFLDMMNRWGRFHARSVITLHDVLPIAYVLARAHQYEWPSHEAHLEKLGSVLPVIVRLPCCPPSGVIEGLLGERLRSVIGQSILWVN